MLQKEYPRGGFANELIKSAEKRLPCVVLIDTSGSMESAADQLYEGLRKMVEAIREDRLVKGKVEFCIITFDDSARITMPFTSARKFEVPRVTGFGGMTAMHEAVQLALNEIEDRKLQYKRIQVPYDRPWIYMLTDGGANDPDNGEFQQVIRAQDEKKCVFFPVAIGDEADIELLKTLRRDGIVFAATKENFTNTFVFLSHSLSLADSYCQEGVKKLPDCKDYQMDIY